MRRTLALCTATLAVVPSADGRTWQVLPDGTGDAPTIQAALSVADPADTVEVACGTYFEHDLQREGPIVLRSMSQDPGCVVIDAQQQGFVLLLAYTDDNSLVEGLTLRGGKTIGVGGGIQVVVGSAVLRNLVIEENSSVGSGAGLACQINASATVIGCSFSNNWGDAAGPSWGGGAWISPDSHAEFIECSFADNSAAAHGGAIYAAGDVTVESCTFVGNEARGINGQGGLGGHVSVTGTLVATKSVFAYAAIGNAIYCNSSSGSATLSCCNVWDNDGGDYTGYCLEGQENINGNFSVDPLFCDPENGDFTIQSDSPCAPPGVTGCGLVGALPVGCGPISVEPKSWARVKANFR
jgi:predicted outer membrane repeat protein